MKRLQHLLEVVHLLGRFILFLFLLGHHPHQIRHITAEAAFHIFDGKIRVLHHIVKKSRNHRIGSQLQFLRHDAGHRHRMNDIRRSAFPLLAGVCLFGKFKSLTDAVAVFHRYVSFFHYGQDRFQLSVH